MATAAEDYGEGARYRAFFSYARADSRLAAKLHRFLDSYRVPKALRGMQGKRGPVPDTLHPIFRDREDLAGGGELGDRLRAALYSSEALIVLCTPASAQSHWVDEEVRLFREKNGNDAIFPVIGAGDPDSDDPAEQCMPPSLRDKAVLAADLRDIRKETGHIVGDGASGGRQKLLAGLLGLDLDQLRRRDEARRRRQMMAMAAALVLFVGLGVAATALGIAARSNAREAEKQAIIAKANAVRAQKGEALARQRAEAEAAARNRETAARKLADEQRKLAEQQRALALANAAEARRQTGIARSNAARAEAQFARAQLALADSFAQRGLAAADAGKRDTALRYALAGAQISPGSRDRQRALLARLTSVPTQRTALDIDTNSISFLAMSPDGRRVMTSGLDKVARLFDATSGDRISLTGGAMKGQTGARPPNARGLNADPTIGGTKLTNNWFSADSARFLMTLVDGSFELRNAETGSAITKVGGHRGPVLSGSFNPDGDRVLTSSLDDSARVWSLATRKEIEAARINVPKLRSAAWASDGSGIVTMSLDQGLQLWRGGAAVASLPNRDANRGALAITADGVQAIEIDETGVIRLSRMADGETEVKLETGDVARGAFAISADSRFVAVGRTDGHIVLWDIATRQPIADFAAHAAAISALTLSPDNRQLATATDKGEVKIWDLVPIFVPYEQLATAYCRALPPEKRRFTNDERAADPLIGTVWGSRDLC